MTPRQWDLIEIALEAAANACVGFATVSDRDNSLANEYDDALDAVHKERNAQ